MLLKYSVPVCFELVAEDLDERALAATLSMRKLHGDVRLVTQGKPQSFDFKGRAYLLDTVERLAIVLDDREDGSLIPLTQAARWSELLTVLREAANNCISQIRSIGGVAHLHTVATSKQESVPFALSEMHVEVHQEGADWRELIAPSDLRVTTKELIAQLVASDHRGHLTFSRWQLVRTALAGGSGPDPAAQCLVNSEEYLDLGDFRLAVLESIMSLELVLANYLRRHCEQAQGMSKGQIDTMLAPSVTLEIRLKVLLPLCLGKQRLSEDILKKVLNVVNWRNCIVHKSGNLPVGVSADTVSDCVQEVIVVVKWLRMKAGNDSTWNSFP